MTDQPKSPTTQVSDATVSTAKAWNPEKATLDQCREALQLLAKSKPSASVMGIMVYTHGKAIEVASRYERDIPVLFQVAGHIAPEHLLKQNLDLSQGSLSTGEGGPIGARRSASMSRATVRGTLEVANLKALATAIGALADVKGQSAEIAAVQHTTGRSAA